MSERINLVIQKIFFNKQSTLTIFSLTMCLFTIGCALLRKNINLEILNTIVNGDMFSISGVLAGFVFSGLSFICASDSPMIKRLKQSGNFNIIKKFYTHSILVYVIVIMLYLIKPLLEEKVLVIFLLVMLFLFIYATILFLFCLFVLDKRINE